MRVESHPQPLFDSIGRAARAAAGDTENDLRAALPRRTGRTAAETRMVETGSSNERTTFSVEGPVQLGPLEHGANVGPRPGPHMTGQHRIADTLPDSWSRHVGERLRQGR